MPRLAHPDSLALQAAAPLRLPVARAFGASADAAHLPRDLLTLSQSARLPAGSCRACCMSASGQTPTPPAAPALPVAQLQTTACRLPCLGSSNHPSPLGQSAASAQHALHCIPA